MRSHRWFRMIALLVASAITAASCGITNDTASTPTSEAPAEQTGPQPPARGDRPGSPVVPPNPAGAATPTSEPPPVLANVNAPVIDLIYAVHVHAEGEYRPFTNESLTFIDTERADGFIAQVMGIAETMESRGARASFHFVYGTAAGLCQHDPTFMPRLLDGGHEIGIHAHNAADLLPAAEALRSECGIDPVAGSGLAKVGVPFGGEVSVESLADGLEAFENAGVQYLVGNLSDLCDGLGYDGFDPVIGNRMVRWTMGTANPCVDDPAGSINYLDHVGPSTMMSNGRPADVLSDVEFDLLAEAFDAALVEAEQSESGELAWGFVSHTHEYVRGASAITLPNEASLASLGRFLDHVDIAVQAGRVRWTTAQEAGSTS